MKVLDLYCCAGGASYGLAYPSGPRGYRIDVTGVDIEPQLHYPFTFIQADVLTLDPKWLAAFDLIWASPPCQSFTAYRRRGQGVGDSALNLIPQTRELLQRSGVPYVIENVIGAPLEPTVMLCGSMFGLDVRRHLIFECSFPVDQPRCRHDEQAPRFPPATNRKNLRRTVEVGVYRIPLAVQKIAMGIDWMPLDKLSQAIPPAFASYLMGQFLEARRDRGVA